MRPMLTALALCGCTIATAVALGLATAPALATTVGGESASAAAPFVLADGAILVPSAFANDPGTWIGGAATADVDVSVLRAAQRMTSTTLQHATGPAGQFPALGGPPAIAAAGDQVAVAWLSGSEIESGLLSSDRAAVTSPAPFTHITGQLGSLNIAVDARGNRAMAWSDTFGVHFDAVGPAGSLGASGVLATATATGAIAVGRDDQGGWWVLWPAGATILADHISADATVHPIVTVGPTTLDDGAVAAPPGADEKHPWTLVADGSGGIRVGLARAIVAVSDAGARTLLTSATSHVLLMADGDRETATAQGLSGGRLAVRPLGAELGRATQLPGTPLAIAYYEARSTIEVLAKRAHGEVYLTAIGRAGRPSRSRRLATCLHAVHAQLEAAAGVVAYACARHDTSRDSVETGGDHLSGHTDVYRLLHGGTLLAHGSLREEIYGY